MITILLVDDHAVVRQGVAAYLSAQENMTIVGEATSGLSASKTDRRTSPRCHPHRFIDARNGWCGSDTANQKHQPPFQSCLS